MKKNVRVSVRPRSANSCPEDSAIMKTLPVSASALLEELAASPNANRLDPSGGS